MGVASGDLIVTGDARGGGGVLAGVVECVVMVMVVGWWWVVEWERAENGKQVVEAKTLCNLV